jgi:polygalacturonase
LNNFDYTAIKCRKHSAVLTDFGAVGDGKTLNTKAFNSAITKLSQYANDGGSMLIVPPGKWLTGSFNLTSHFTLFLQKDAVIIGSQVYINIITLLFCNNLYFYKKLNGHFYDAG